MPDYPDGIHLNVQPPAGQQQFRHPTVVENTHTSQYCRYNGVHKLEAAPFVLYM